jgi:ribose-phosphate pyrophosphokinase
MGVTNIITFDAHDPRVQNSIPLQGMDNFMPTYQFIQALFQRDHDLKIDKSSMMIISPDEGAIDRAAYVANNLGVDMGMFYKRRDYSTVINGKNPIVAHEFLGSDVTGKIVIIVDDMISSGESMLDTARELKERGAHKVIILTTFGLFTDGYQKFDEFHNRGYFDYVVATNLIYEPEELLDKPWYIEADMTRFTARIIDTLNHDQTMADLMAPTSRIQRLVSQYNEAKKNEFSQFKLELE